MNHGITRKLAAVAFMSLALIYGCDGDSSNKISKELQDVGDAIADESATAARKAKRKARRAAKKAEREAKRLAAEAQESFTEPNDGEADGND